MVGQICIPHLNKASIQTNNLILDCVTPPFGEFYSFCDLRENIDDTVGIIITYLTTRI